MEIDPTDAEALAEQASPLALRAISTEASNTSSGPVDKPQLRSRIPGERLAFGEQRQAHGGTGGIPVCHTYRPAKRIGCDGAKPHCRTYYKERDYENAVAAARRLVVDRPDHPWAHRLLAAALGQLGRSDEARAALDKAIAIAPDAFHLFVDQPVPWMRQVDYDHMLNGLRKAGWQG